MSDKPSSSPEQRWSRLVEDELGQSLSARRSLGGSEYEPVYFAEGTAEVPGHPPFTRGPYASMYRGRPWTVRQYSGFSTAEETNAMYRKALAQGQKGLSVAFDLATHRGYDSDHERVAGDVGKAGVAVDSVEDMRRLFEGIRLEEVSVSMTMSGAVLPVMAAYLVAAEEQGVPFAALRGTMQNDILKELIVRNTYIYPPSASLRIVTDVIEFATNHVPKFNPISISGYHLQEAGAPAELELAYTLGNGLEYVRAAVERGLDIERFVPRLSFFFGVGMQFFLEVAKLRAARQLWARLLVERFSLSRPELGRLRTHCQTSGVSLTAQAPLNNVARTTLEALAAVLGGTQSLHTNGYDEALGIPSDVAASVARGTQLILREETDVAHTVDPLAGSYLVESLTEQVSERAREYLAEVDELGGMTRAIEAGLPQRRIAEAALQRQVRFDTGQETIVGVNRYGGGPEPDLEVRFIDQRDVLEKQRQRLVELRARRDVQAVERSLAALEHGAAHERCNLLELSVDCLRARATVGEVSARLEKIFGRHAPPQVTVAGVFSSAYRDGPEWQAVHRRIEEFEQRFGRRPRILVAKLGQDGHDRGAKVIASGFADLGFDVDVGPLFQTPREVAQAAIDNDVHVVGISTQAGGHTTLVPALLTELRSAGADDILVVCGGIIPRSDREALERAGVAAVFGPGAKVIDCVQAVLLLLLPDPAGDG